MIKNLFRKKGVRDEVIHHGDVKGKQPCTGCDEVNKCEYLGECQKSEKIKIAQVVGKHEENFTECDKCDMLSECIKDNGLINIRTSDDNFDHYVLGVGCFCSKDQVSKLINAYKSYRCVYKEVREYLGAPDITVGYRVDELTKRYQEAHDELMESLDELLENLC